MLRGAPDAEKTAYLYDHLDIPNVVNYIAVANLVGHFDSDEKNFYVHRDEPSGLWQLYPWDLSNTFGVSNGGAACQNGDALEVSCRNNEMWQSLAEVPEIREMVFRRMRTLVDGPLADGNLEGLFDQYNLTVSPAERAADSSFWSMPQYRPTADLHAEIDLRRAIAEGSPDLPASLAAAPLIVINELTYSPSSDVEFLELHNLSGESVDLSDWEVDGIGLDIPGGTVLLDGDYLVLTSSIADFQVAYPSIPNVALVEFDGGLNGGGELVRLIDDDGVVVDEVEYSSVGAWPNDPSNGLVSLSLFDPTDDNADGSNWGISQAIGGTPGTANDTVAGTVAAPPNIVINEIHYNPDGPDDSEFISSSTQKQLQLT